MVSTHQEGGFTIIETVVTLIVMAIFLTLFFQGFLVVQAQQLNVRRLSEANDIAMANLAKYPKRAQAAAVACDPTVGAGNTNDLTQNPSAQGTAITVTSTPALSPESLTNTNLPSSTIQMMYIKYPQGCGLTAPITVVSVVKYGTETVTHASFVN